jgi:hypothetical protein
MINSAGMYRTFKGRITDKLKGNDGVVNICQRNGETTTTFDNNGRNMGGIVNAPSPNHYGEIELKYIVPEYDDYLNTKIKCDGQFKAIDDNKNPTTSNRGYFSLFDALLKKFPGEIYVLLAYGGCYCFDKNKNLQGLFTFYNTGFGYLNCEVPLYQFAKEQIEQLNKKALKYQQNHLEYLKKQQEVVNRNVEEQKLVVEAMQQSDKKEIQTFTKEWGYLKK